MRSIRTKLIVFIIIVSIIPAVIISLIGYDTAKNQITSAFNTSQLRSESFQRGNAIRLIVDDGLFKLNYLLADTRFQEILLNQGVPNEALKSSLRQQVFKIDVDLENSGIRYVILVDASGKIVFSTDKQYEGLVLTDDKIHNYIQPFLDGRTKPIVSYDKDRWGNRELLFIGPVYENNDRTTPIGVLTIIGDLINTDLIILDHSGLGETGETYLVNSNRVMVTESRFSENATFNQKVDTPAVNECFESGKNIELSYDDYRGIKVYGVTYCANDLGFVLVTEMDYDEITAPLERLGYVFVIIGSTITITAAIIATLWIKKQTSPIAELQKATDEIIHGNYDTSVNVRSDDELGQLGNYFNKMAQDIKQKIVVERELSVAKKVQKEKDEFVTMIAHELKTPLLPILGHCSMLKKGSMGKLNEDQISSIDEIYSSIIVLRKQIENILTGHKLELNELKLNMQTLSVSELVKGAYDSLLPIMSEKNIEFVNSCENNLEIEADKERLREVFTNLVQNAVDFVHQNGTIEIGAKKQEDNVLFYVKDDGVGIPKDRQQKLFKKFYQIDTTTTRQRGGTGLGLAICKGIIEAMNGKIWVESEEDKGATFFFTLPAKK